MKRNIKWDNTQLQLSQDLGNSAILEQALNNTESPTPQALPAYYNKLHPFSLGERIGLSLGKKIAWKCSCGYRWVWVSQRGVFTIWICEKCETPRLAHKEKSDIELISEVLKHPDLKGWDGVFLREMQRGRALGRKQREKLRGIAQKLGVKMFRVWDISDAAEEVKP